MDTLPFRNVWDAIRKNSMWHRGIPAFIAFIEGRLGAKFVYDARTFRSEDTDMLDLLEIGEQLKSAGIITSYSRVFGFPDEPPLSQWRADIADGKSAGGYSVLGDRAALTATLAEALERHIWNSAIDYFDSPTLATAEDILRKGRALKPKSFVGFSVEDREGRERLALRADARYLWIRGHSLIDNEVLWIPAQVISGKHGGENYRSGSEPVIREPITTGLATGPTREFARLNGVLEIIERDAFMITWLNKLTPPRIDLLALRRISEPLDTLLVKCERYNLHFDAAILPTDAPAYAVCGVVTDGQAKMPPRTVGLKAHRNLADAVIGAAHEALRMRHNARWLGSQKPLDPKKGGREIMHVERLLYWAKGDIYKKLDFLVKGEITYPHAAWDTDSENEHLKRIVAWCKEHGQEIASVPMSKSAKNVMPWHVEMVVMPHLIPLHQNEKNRYAGGERRSDVPKMFGFVPRAEPYSDEPHPFA